MRLFKMFRSKKGSKKTFVQMAVVVLGLTATHSLVAFFPSMLSPVVAQSNSPSPSFPLPKSLPSGTILKADGSGSMRVNNEALRKRSQEKFPGTKAQSNSPSPSFPVPKSLPSGTTVKVDGSSSMSVINEALRKGFEEKFPGTKVELASGGTDGALAALLRGDINMAAVGRSLTDKEKAQGLVATPVSREKIAIIVGSDNPFKKNLTFVELAKMFRGEIADWSQLGGAPGKIRFIDHPEWGDTRRSLGTYDIFKKAPFKNGANTTRLSQDDTASIVQALGKDGISYAIADQVLNLPNVRVIPIYQTMPSDPRYPYSQPRSYVYPKETATPGMLAFLGFVTSASGQDILAAAKQEEAEAVRQSIASASTSGTSGVGTGSSPSPAPNDRISLVPTSTGEPTEQGFPWWWLLLLAGIPLLGLLWLLLKERRDRRTEINNKIENLRNDWNRTFMSLVTVHGDEVINTIGSRESFNRVITQKLVNNNAEFNHYISQQIDNIFEQKLQNHMQVIARNLVQNNEQLKQYIDQGLQHCVTSNTEMNNQLLNLVANSTETNNKIENLRNHWNQNFMSLVIQHVDELSNTIGSRETFNRLITQNLVNNNAELNHYVSQQIDNYDQKIQNYISVITQNSRQEIDNTYINELIRTKNELTGLMNNADRNLYEWTLGELMAIKGCLSDREVLVEQLVTFSAQLRTKLDGTACVDINTFKPFKAISIDHKQQP